MNEKKTLFINNVKDEQNAFHYIITSYECQLVQGFFFWAGIQFIIKMGQFGHF